MSSYIQTNNETGKDEIFAGNSCGPLAADLVKGVPSIRLGRVAYDVHGVRLPPRYRPIFFLRSDSAAYDAVYTARLKLKDQQYENHR